MTEQYQQNNINIPRGVKNVSADLVISFDDELVVADSSLNIITLQLPDAGQIPGINIYIKAPFGDVNPVTVICVNAQTIDGAATLVLDTSEASALLVSDGSDWQAFGTGGSAVIPDQSITAAKLAPDVSLIRATFNIVFTDQGNIVAGPNLLANSRIIRSEVAVTTAFDDTSTTVEIFADAVSVQGIDMSYLGEIELYQVNIGLETVAAASITANVGAGANTVGAAMINIYYYVTA